MNFSRTVRVDAFLTLMSEGYRTGRRSYVARARR